MTNSQSVTVAFPNEVMTTSDECEQSSHACTIQDMEKVAAKHEDRRDESTGGTSFSESTTNHRDLSKKSVCFDQMATQTIVRNWKTDLSPEERRNVWYSGQDISEFSSDYSRELHLELYRVEQVKKLNKKKKSPVQKIKKFFGVRKKSK